MSSKTVFSLTDSKRITKKDWEIWGDIIKMLYKDSQPDLERYQNKQNKK
jgi:hypothetical protein